MASTNTKLAPAYAEVQFSPVWVKKMRTLFRALDSACSAGNSSGELVRRYLSLDNLLAVAHEFIANNARLDDYRQDQLVESAVELWLQLCNRVEEEEEKTAAEEEEKDKVEEPSGDLEAPAAEVHHDSSHNDGVELRTQVLLNAHDRAPTVQLTSTTIPAAATSHITAAFDARLKSRINEDAFLAALRANINRPSLREAFLGLVVRPFFEAVDADSDGRITLPEFKALARGWRSACTERDLEGLFRGYDRDNDERITLEEAHQMWAQFFLSEEQQAAANKMFGPLVSYPRPEDFAELQCSVYWEGKMRNMFRRLDLNGVGTLRCHDVLQIARSLIKRGHFNKAKADSILRAMIDLWVKYMAVDFTGNHYHELTEQTFVHNMRSLVNSEHRHDFDLFGWTFFRAVEAENSGGFITIQGYRNLQEAWNISREEADAMFKILDKDKDGKISGDEYLSAFLDYFLGEDKNSCFKSFFGPIVTCRHSSFCEDLE